MELIVVVGMLGLLVGFVSGLLGIGGGILMTPLLLYLPPLLGLGSLSMHTVAGLTIIQGLAASASGAFGHRRFVSMRLVGYMGTSIFMAALIGGAAARFLSNEVLLTIFGVLATLAALLMLRPMTGDLERPDVETLSFGRLRAVASASGVGLLGGIVGQGGAFILIPLMTSFAHVPTRIALSSNLAIVLISSLAAFAGKALTGQIEWLMALPLVLTVLPATHLGSRVSHRVPVASLRRWLTVLIALAAIRIWATVLSG